MIRRLFALTAGALLAIALATSSAAALECNQTAIYDSNATGATKQITGVPASSVYICGYTFVSGGTSNVSIKSGTGTNCGTGTAAVTPAFAMVANGVINDTSPVWRGLLVAPAKDVCINSSGTTIAVQAIIYYRIQ